MLVVCVKAQMSECCCYVVADVGACEYINNIKTKGDFEEQLHTEHCNNISTFLLAAAAAAKFFN